MVVDVNSAEARGASSWDPLPVSIIVHHDSSPSLADALFTVETQSRSSAHTHTHTRVAPRVLTCFKVFRANRVSGRDSAHTHSHTHQTHIHPSTGRRANRSLRISCLMCNHGNQKRGKHVSSFCTVAPLKTQTNDCQRHCPKGPTPQASDPGLGEQAAQLWPRPIQPGSEQRAKCTMFLSSLIN